MSSFAFDVSHFLAGVVVLMSFAMLYQDRLPPLINAFMVQSLVLACAVARRRFPAGARPARRHRSSRKQSERAWRQQNVRSLRLRASRMVTTQVCRPQRE
jgi:hypothetical protein